MEKQTNAPEPDASETCASCGAKLKGDYCGKCGEKKIVPERDFSLLKFLKQTLGHFVHFDSKLLRTGWLLFSKPGFLSAEWTAGRRMGYMKPLQLFVVAGLLFYFFLPTATAYFTSYRDLTVGYQERNFMMNTFQYDSGKAVIEKTLALQIEEATLKREIIEGASQRSKTWLFLLIPCWGALIYLFFRRKIPWLVPHLIFAMHGLTFYILLDLSLHAVFTIIGVTNSGKYIFLLLLTMFSGYQGLAVHRFYRSSGLITILKTLGIMVGFIVLILLYRQIITIWSIAAIGAEV
ncbi:MAG: DUF3667 domain-containing protein [Saprospiraceae bacterium]